MPKSSKKFRVTNRDPELNWVPDSEQKYAAIDIGSNGVRLLLSKVMTTGAHCVFAKESLVRMPIRLGADVFRHQAISPQKEEQLVSTLIAFSHLIKAYEPRDYRACATSAMREARNGASIAARIKEESQLNLEVIDGGVEAEMIFASHIAETLHPDRAYLYIDVGGGSTELTFFARSERLISRSFPIGSVRLLNRQVSQSVWDDMQAWVLKYRPVDIQLSAIGSGGNMNKILRLSSSKFDKPVSFTELNEIDAMLNSYNIEERIRVLHLRPDRADVIIHASKIFKSIMQWGEIDEIFVPQFGLADGLVHHMHDEYVKNQ
ncbi:MAG: exopolyphosphatase [FCB group bacterium]|nr:exopolyphosphatase [FCB group bacterium]MBL7027976.1 exopolyphosphatase [Candidatus Neomarinimicrobiota bacterium]MBL7122885.1 exopolyphosphatase [Candidatus Neomarinimicrobiota bacterium]